MQYQRGNGLSLFPNPAQNFIIVQNTLANVIANTPERVKQSANQQIDSLFLRHRYDGFRMKIQNINGKTLKTIPLNSRLYQQQINVSDLVNGVYFVSFTVNDEQISIEKLVIAR